MTDEEIIKAINGVSGLQTMTVNERIYLTGLWDEFDKAKVRDKEKARKILEWLNVDKPSIDKIIL